MNNINLTLDYLQEEDSTQKLKKKEEDNNSFSTSFDLFYVNPGHKTYRSTGLIRTRHNLTYDLLFLKEFLVFPWEMFL